MSVEPATSKFDEKTEHRNANANASFVPPTIKVSTSLTDLEAARSSARASATTSPALSRHLIPPSVALHPNGSAPASVTSLPENGIMLAPTHRRRRARRRRQLGIGQAMGQTGTSGPIAIAPRRANSLPANPVSTIQPPTIQPVDWLHTFKNLDTLLQPAKKLAVEPTLTQSFST
jgi:hypothetical protein